jgi:putative spermidine/putrescine transport system substrate-binding protein
MHAQDDLIAGPHTRRMLLTRGARLAGGLAVAGPAASWLAACGGGSSSTSSAPAAPSASEIGAAAGTVNVLGWSYYEVPQFETAKVKAKWGFLGTNEDTITKSQQAGTFDLTTITSAYEPQLRKASRIQPIDPARIPNIKNIDPVFINSSSIRFDGKVWGIPMEWGYGYVEYDTRQTTKPTSFADLMSPTLRKKIGIPDDPFAVITTFAYFTGQPRPTQLTQSQFKEVLAALNKFKPQILTIHQYGEEPAIIARGDMAVDFPAYGPSFLTARKSGAKTEITLLGAWSYIDCWTLYKGANEPLAYAYVNESLTPAAQRACVTKGAAFPVVNAAIGAVPKELRYTKPADVIRKAPIVPGPPADSSGGVVPFSEWIHAWEQFKASV